jgi:hypothetical protein
MVGRSAKGFAVVPFSCLRAARAHRGIKPSASAESGLSLLNIRRIINAKLSSVRTRAIDRIASEAALKSGKACISKMLP